MPDKFKFQYLPRNLVFLFMTSTLLMFSISPWRWPVRESFLFYFFNVSFIVAFWIGYKFGIKRFRFRESSKKIDLLKWINISLLINLFFIYPKFLFRLKVPSLSVSEFINNLVLGIFNPSLAYATRHSSDFGEFASLSNPLMIIYFLSLPLQYFVIPLGLLYWQSLRSWQKISYIIIVLMDILSYVMIGTNKGIFDYIILIPTIAVIKNPNLLHFKKFLTKSKLKYFIVSLTILSLGLIYFIEGNKGRKGANFGYESSTGLQVDRDAFILKLVPETLEDGYIALDSYLTGGYYAMGLALELDHQFTYGLGHNSFLISVGEKILGENTIQDKTYQARMDDLFNYNRYTKWHTFYVGMANDFTFFGVIVIVFFIAYYLAQIWIDVFNHGNLNGIILLPMFFTIIIYLSANNQVLGNQSSSFIFWYYFLKWLSSRGKNFVLK